jgi:Tol biopolymer transport system component
MIERILILLIFSISSAVAQPPGTEIYLFDLKVKSGKVILRNPKNITNRKGYDNQPFFHPEKGVLYFVSADEEGRTDIMEYNYTSGETKKFATTHDREYSPIVTPDKQFISCILQRDSGAQDLVKYPIAGGEPQVLINDLTVGYHAWADPGQVVVFTLPRPFKLQLVDVASKQYTVVATEIGRSIHKIPRQNAISFLQKVKDDEWVINKLNPTTKEVSLIAKSLPGNEHDMAWTPDGKMIMSKDKELFVFSPGKQDGWTPVVITSEVALSTLSRLAISPDGKKIALVVSEQ